MDRDMLARQARVLADMWTDKNPALVLDRLEAHPPATRAALAAIVSNHLDACFADGPNFRTALMDRALLAEPPRAFFGFGAPEPRARIKMVCATCGSDDVLRDAWAEWDVEQQQWVLQNVFDHAVCEGACEGETRIKEIAA
jgi:hypothetical protein